MGKKEEFVIAVPYDDFVCGLQALRILISARQMLKSGDAFASDGLKAILGIKTEEGDKDAGKD
jgi:hypothetical protein